MAKSRRREIVKMAAIGWLASIGAAVQWHPQRLAVRVAYYAISRSENLYYCGESGQQ